MYGQYKTIHTGHGEENTWYTVSSTDRVTSDTGYGIRLRNVAWDNAGEEIENKAYWGNHSNFSMETLNTPTKYNINLPDVCF